MELHDLTTGVLCVGFNGTTADAELRTFKAGGVILSSRNVVSMAQTRKLTDEIRSLYAGDADPLIAIDQEGGRVARLHDGIVELPPMMALGAAGDETLARRAGREVGVDLRRAGVNFTFGPVLDLAVYRDNTIIGTRSFGSDPAAVARIAGAFAGGLRESGIITAFKHFPGHGATAANSNNELPVIDAPASTLRARDIVPFQKLLPRAEAVMTAHIIAKGFDSEHPATTSRIILQDLLRRDLGFRGVCVSDCMQMDAVSKTIGVAEGAIAAIDAGVDCLLVSRSIALARAMVLAISRAVMSGRLPRARLEEAYARVLDLRKKLAQPLAVDAPRPDPNVGSEIAQRAITLVRGKASADPAKSIVVSFESTVNERTTAGTVSRYESLAASRGIPEIKVQFEAQPAIVEGVLSRLSKSERTPIVLMRRAHKYPKQAATIERILKAFPDAILVSMWEPYDAMMFDQARNVLCAYGDETVCITGLADVLFKGVPARGKLPVNAGVPTAV